MMAYGRIRDVYVENRPFEWGLASAGPITHESWYFAVIHHSR